MKNVNVGMPIMIYDHEDCQWKRDKVVSLFKGGFYVKEGIKTALGNTVEFLDVEEDVNWKHID